MVPGGRAGGMDSLLFKMLGVWVYFSVYMGDTNQTSSSSPLPSLLFTFGREKPSVGVMHPGLGREFDWGAWYEMPK